MFENPALLLLAVPAAALFAAMRGKRLFSSALRGLLLALLVVLAAGPRIQRAPRSMDVVVVVDRSRSMPPDAEARSLEIIGLIEKQRPPGGEIGIVVVGGRSHIEQLPRGDGRFPGFTKDVDADASNLAEGIDTALNLIRPDRAGRIVVLSDGLATGRDPRTSALAAGSDGIPIDYRCLRRPDLLELAIQRVQVPREVDAGSAFPLSAWVSAERDMPVRYVVTRNGATISEGETVVRAGVHPLYFRDRLPNRGGLYRYRIEVRPKDGPDPIPENNAAEAVVRALDAPRVLLVTNHKTADRVVASMRAAGMTVDQVDPANMPRSLEALDAYRVVVLEDVSANDVGAPALASLRKFVEDGGGGLLVTGGRASFGVGGYFKSDLDGVLPVSMEMRKEQRKFRLAMAIVLDRSGSMMAPVGGGLVKMDLANRGAAETIKLLTAQDEVTVIPVDSAAHVLVPLTPVSNPAELTRTVLRVQSQGGGIFVHTGLLAAGKELQGSTAATRHIVLFADAADAEEPGDYVALLDRYRKAGITVSVIGLGTESDPDAAFLKDVAKRGGGRVFFTDRPNDLPRLFAQETLEVARSAFVEEKTKVRWLPDSHLIGPIAGSAFPEVGGYNLTYLRPEAAVAAISQDEFKAPVLAFWNRGVGRVVAFTAEADGPYSGGLAGWAGAPTLFAEMTRWLMGAPEPEGISVSVKVEEPEVLVTFEFDPETAAGKEAAAFPPMLALVRDGDDPTPPLVPFQWVSETKLQARFSMEREGVYLPMVRFGSGRLVRLPPAMLPYSPEFLPRAQDGEALLDEMAQISGGRRRATLDGVFEGTRGGAREAKSLRAPFALVILVVLLLDIAARRLHLWDLGWVVRAERWCHDRFRRRPSPESAAAVTMTVVVPPPAAPVAPPPPPPAAAVDALSEAKRRARKRFGES